ncbi:solute carrier family 2, facilitated glucose transporter member 11-like [Danio rerio]|uniref:Solute carrier family 2, facilitated glucose transporter member 11-like n=1 Tax=Danio rerio TaxID=7955 RepID=A0AC58GLU4_DANRE
MNSACHLYPILPSNSSKHEKLHINYEKSCTCCSHFHCRYWRDLPIRLPYFCPELLVTSMCRLWGTERDPGPEMEELLAKRAALKGVKIHRLKDLFLDHSVCWQLLTVLVTFVSLQLCGINAVYLYSLDVFQAAGIGKENLRYAAVGIGLCEFSTSITCVLIIESIGKRVFLFQSYICMAATLALPTLTIYLQV